MVEFMRNKINVENFAVFFDETVSARTDYVSKNVLNWLLNLQNCEYLGHKSRARSLFVLQRDYYGPDLGTVIEDNHKNICR